MAGRLLILGLLLATAAAGDDAPAWLAPLLAAPDAAARQQVLAEHELAADGHAVSLLTRAAEAARDAAQAQQAAALARELAAALADQRWAALAASTQGWVSARLEQWPAAAAAFAEAEGLWRRAGIGWGTRAAAAWRAWCRWRNGEAGASADLARSTNGGGTLAGEVAEAGIKRSQAVLGWALICRGQVEEDLQRWPEAERAYREAVPAFERSALVRGVAYAADRAGLVCYYQSKLADAEALYRASLSAAERLGDPQAIGRAHLGFAEIGCDRAQYDQVLAELDLAEAGLRQADDPGSLARVYWLRAVVRQSRGEHHLVEAELLRAESLYRAHGMDWGVAHCQFTRGTNLLLLGDRARALQALDAAAATYEAGGDLLGLANARLKQAQACYVVAMYDRAAALGAEALRLYQRVADRVGEGNVLRLLGQLAHQAADLAGALAHYRAALAVSRAAEDRLGEATALYRLGLVLEEQDDREPAIEALLEAMEMSEAMGDAHGAALPALALGRLCLRYRDAELARNAFLKALALAEQCGSRQVMAHALYELGRWCEVVEPPLAEQAAGFYRSAIDVVEQMRERAGGREAQQGLQAGYAHYYEALVRVLLRLERAADAFAAAERAHGRSLLELMVDAGVDPDRGLKAEQRAEQEQIRRGLTAATLRYARAAASGDGGQSLKAARQDVDTARKALAAFEDRLVRGHPELAPRRAPEPADAAQVAAALPADAALVEFLVGERASYVFVITPGEAAVRAFELAVEGEALARQVASFRAACANPRRRFRAPGEEIYQRLLAPVAGALGPAVRRLVLVPDGPLHELPVQALPEGDERFVIDRWGIGCVASASTWLASVHRAAGVAPDGLLAFADPVFGTQQRSLDPARSGPLEPLPGTRAEAEALRALFGDRAAVYLGAEAREEVAKANLSRYRYVHFASHGLLDAASPLYSAVVLTQPDNDTGEDGRLEARELLDLPVAADLVTLSACDTGLGSVRPGEGLLGFTWAFTAAGARSLVVSQWQVSDETTPLLMRAFYERLVAGADKGEALRQAALGLRGSHPHPYHWAPFVLYGSWQ